MNDRPTFGFRVVGRPTGRRWLVDASLALVGYAGCDPRINPADEAYLGVFWFGSDFVAHMKETGSTKGFNGPCWSPYLWFDIDRDGDADGALTDARALVGCLLDRYRELDEEDLFCYFSGNRGYHVGLPMVWDPPPALDFNRTARHLAERLAGIARVRIDVGIYDKVHLFRAPNSRHPKTSLHKRWLTHDELMRLTAERIRQLATNPIPFDLHWPAATCTAAADDWAEAECLSRRQTEEKARRSVVANGAPRLNRLTFDFILNGATEGERHSRLFSAAANLAEFQCPPALAHAILTDAGLDSGLPPSEVRRQIDCGLAHCVNAASETWEKPANV